MTRLAPIDTIRPSTYNPRKTDPKRLDLIELSLRKLGFLLPIYADRSGEILSGHQRFVVARRLGVTQVPVEFTPPMDLAERKAINIVFNRATNDLSCSDTAQGLTESLARARVRDVAKTLPDKTPESPEFYPCLMVRRFPVRPLLRANRGRWVPYAASVSRTLYRKGILMPILLRPDQRVVNGIGRLEMLAEMKAPTAPCIVLPETEAELAERMLNLLSMDFTIETRYADLLRYNSFRRARRSRWYLGRGFVFAVVGDVAANQFDIRRDRDRKRWARIHGETILDFGAGHLTETILLREAGFDVTPFEPYRLGPDHKTIDKAESTDLTKRFLAAVAGGKTWSSIFLASVLNSVPFAADRRHIVTLCAALCEARTALYAVASSTDQVGWKSLNGKQYANRTHLRNLTFPLNYEDNIQLGDIAELPKVQRYHTPEQFRELFATEFQSVKVSHYSHNVQAVCRRRRPIRAEALRAALEFEFNLPYPDGSRLGLVEEAKRAFSQRLEASL